MSLSKPIAQNQNMTISPINSDSNTFRVLQETLYPGSTDQEVAMILSYCKARKIDPILKPVHLVPMSVKTDKKDKDGKFIYQRKNVIMPGIGLYRIDASRSGQYAGVSEPEFGEEITREFGDKLKKKVTFPKWAKVTVKKIIADGSIAEFTAKEFWLENYASKSKFDDAPNDMWEKRAYGQLAKCAEAQALRKAFPDVVGNEYTKEEMEGKLHHHDEQQQKPQTYTAQPEPIPVVPAELHDIDQDILDISWANDIEDLLNIYTKSYKYWISQRNNENIKKCIDAKDKRKLEIESALKTETDEQTGEVKQ